MADSIDWVKSLVQLMTQNGLAELTLEEEGRKVRLRKAGELPRGAGPMLAASPHAAYIPPPPAPAAAGAPAGGAAAGAKPATPERAPDVVEILSPMVGTFYRSASPEAELFVNVGDGVTPETTLCIIEAMKVMNEIKAEMEGTVQEILVSNGEAVEYGQPLFLLKRK